MLTVSHAIDRISAGCRRVASWFVLLACLISAGNAVSRTLFSVSSNAWLEIQWQLFAGIFLLGAAHVFRLNEHVRVDLLYGHRSKRGKLWTGVVGIGLFFLPTILFILVLLCVNMQTSFMHPPFGFALFHLRGVAPKEVRSSDIYWGSIPWIILQVILVAVVIASPASVTTWIGGQAPLSQEQIRRSLDAIPLPGDDGMPQFDPAPPKIE